MTAVAVQTVPVERLAYTRAELAAALGQGVKKIDDARRDGIIPSFMFGGTRLFPVGAVKGWLASQVFGTAAQAVDDPLPALVLRALEQRPDLAAQVMELVDELRDAQPAPASADRHLQVVHGT